MCERARENFAAAGVDAAVESRINDAFNEIAAVPGEFDLLFMDTGTISLAYFSRWSNAWTSLVG